MANPEQIERLTNLLYIPVQNSMKCALDSGVRKVHKLNGIQTSMKVAIGEKIPSIDNSLGQSQVEIDACLDIPSDTEKFPTIQKTFEEAKRKKLEEERNPKVNDAISNADQSSSNNDDIFAALRIRDYMRESQTSVSSTEVPDLNSSVGGPSTPVEPGQLERYLEKFVLDQEDSEMDDSFTTAYEELLPDSPDSIVAHTEVAEKRITRAGTAAQLGDTATSADRRRKQKRTSDLQAAGMITPSVVRGRITADHLRAGLKVLARVGEKWSKADIVKVDGGTPKQVNVKLPIRKRSKTLTLPEHRIACIETHEVLNGKPIFVGARVAAHYEDEGIYPAIVAEAASKHNGNRLLLFYDDGYATYCEPKKVYLVYGMQEEVWRDFPEQNDDGLAGQFVREFLAEKERVLLKMEVDKSVFVEYNGECLEAKAVEVDSSLVLMEYKVDQTTEWIYRGSLRFVALQKHKEKGGKKPSSLSTRQQTSEFEYFNVDPQSEDEREDSPPAALREKVPSSSEEGDDDDADDEDYCKEDTVQPRMKSQRKTKTVLRFNESADGPLPAEGDVDDFSDGSYMSDYEFTQPTASTGNKRASRKIKLPSGISRRDAFSMLIKYDAHTCNPCCLTNYIAPTSDDLKGINPLEKPMKAKWKRRCAKYTYYTGRSLYQVFYEAPCGRKLKDLAAVCSYLHFHKIDYLDIDHFCFEPGIRTIGVQVYPEGAKFYTEDFTNGKEAVPVPCINLIDASYPLDVPYTKDRIPGKGVLINTKSDFMVCCSCTDGCRDREKCECQQLTIQATECSYKSKINKRAGYSFKRLKQFIVSGIYECNKNCSCNRNCRNRVVQNGLQMRLQLFKTHNKGWGIRCLDDIAKGAFVCIYTGKIQSEGNANHDGLRDGDEYLAELDLIEVAENRKTEQYENQSGHSSGIEMEDASSDAGYPISGGYPIASTKRVLPDETLDTTDTDTDSELYQYDPRTDELKPKVRKKKAEEAEAAASETPVLNQTSSADANQTRLLFGETDDPYVIDAKKAGNLGRYLNHSCEPNLFVQNVFIDTHDLRFPWVAFFSNSVIRAGTELTWDYNYELGSVPNKQIMCYCGTTKCRKRLL